MRSDLLASIALRGNGVYLAANDGRGAARAPVCQPDRRVAAPADRCAKPHGRGRAVPVVRAGGPDPLGCGDGACANARWSKREPQAAPATILAARRPAGPVALVGAGRRRLPGARGGQRALPRRAIRGRARRIRARRGGLAGCAGDRGQPGQRLVPAVRLRPGARALSRSVGHGRSVRRQPREVQHRRRQVSAGARRHADLPGRAERDPRGDRFLSRQPARWIQSCTTRVTTWSWRTSCCSGSTSSRSKGNAMPRPAIRRPRRTAASRSPSGPARSRRASATPRRMPRISRGARPRRRRRARRSAGPGIRLEQGRSPQPMSPEAAEEMLEMLRERSEASQSLREAQQRARMREAGLAKTW